MRLIDADALRKNMEFVCMGVMAGTENFNAPLLEIDNAPTITSEPHWIPVTEATPTEDDDYWATFDAETGRFVDWCGWYHGRWVTWLEGSPLPTSNVIAWCELPEPYKGVTE